MLELLKEIIAAKSTHGGPCLPEIIPSSLTASNSMTVHGDYQYASSQFLRHVKSTGRSLESSSTIPCTCLSELVPILYMSNFTSDDHASLVIRVIQCIAAWHLSSEADQCETEQTLDLVSAG